MLPSTDVERLQKAVTKILSNTDGNRPIASPGSPFTGWGATTRDTCEAVMDDAADGDLKEPHPASHVLRKEPKYSRVTRLFSFLPTEDISGAAVRHRRRAQERRPGDKVTHKASQSILIVPSNLLTRVSRRVANQEVLVRVARLPPPSRPPRPVRPGRDARVPPPERPPQQTLQGEVDPDGSGRTTQTAFYLLRNSDR